MASNLENLFDRFASRGLISSFVEWDDLEDNFSAASLSISFQWSPVDLLLLATCCTILTEPGSTREGSGLAFFLSFLTL